MQPIKCRQASNIPVIYNNKNKNSLEIYVNRNFEDNDINYHYEEILIVISTPKKNATS